MDFTTPAPSFVVPTQPVFAEQAQQVRHAITGLSIDALQGVMRTSPRLTAEVHEVYTHTHTKPAFWVYHGDVFKGVQAHTLTREAAQWAQRHVLVPSAVYGLVRPYDAIQPYRLEMRAKLRVGEAQDMYAFWGDQLARYVASYRQKDLLVLSSKEYSRAVLRHLVRDIRVVTPVFLDTKPDGSVAQVPIYSKMMRGVMARWVVDHRITSADDVMVFAAHGYAYDAKRSTPAEPVFLRQEMKPLVFDES